MRMGIFRALHACTTSLIFSLLPIFPGFMRTASMNSAQYTANLWLKCISTTKGKGLCALISFKALASAISRQARRTISAPAKYKRLICSKQPFMSRVFAKSIDCTDIGASPPTSTLPTLICFVFTLLTFIFFL